MTWKRRKITQRRKQEEKKRSQPTITWTSRRARRRRRKSARHGNDDDDDSLCVHAGQIYLILVVHAKRTKSHLERERKKSVVHQYPVAKHTQKHSKLNWSSLAHDDDETSGKERAEKRFLFLYLPCSFRFSTSFLHPELRNAVDIAWIHNFAYRNSIKMAATKPKTRSQVRRAISLIKTWQKWPWDFEEAEREKN